jgi:ribosomal protein L40E
VTALIESTCKSAPADRIKDISDRLFEEGEIRRKRREEWNKQRLDQQDAELKEYPDTNHANPGEVEDPDNPRYEQLFAAAQRYQAAKQGLRDKAKEKENTYLAEHSVHRELEQLNEEDEQQIFDSLFGESSQRENRFAQRIRNQLQKEKDAMFNLRIAESQEEYNQVVEEASERLYEDHKLRQKRHQARVKMNEQIAASQKGKPDTTATAAKQAAIQNDPNAAVTTSRKQRFQMLYVDSLRRLERQRVLQEKAEREEEQMLKSMQIFKSPEKIDAPDQLDRIFNLLYNPQTRKVTLSESGQISIKDGDSEKAASPSSPKEKGKGKTPSSAAQQKKKEDDQSPKSARTGTSKSKHSDKSQSPRKARSKDRDAEEEEELPFSSKLTGTKRDATKNASGKKTTARTKQGHDEEDDHDSRTGSKSARRRESPRDDGKKSTGKKERHESPRDDERKRGKTAPRSKTPPPSNRRQSVAGEASRRSQSTPAKKGLEKSLGYKPDLKGRKSQQAQEKSGKMSLKQQDLDLDSKAAKDKRLRKAGQMLRKQEVDEYDVKDWHPAYRPSLLMRLDPTHRAKVEADLDFRDMMATTPLMDREFCPACNALYSPDAAFCRRCGTRRENGPEPAEPNVSFMLRIFRKLNEKGLRGQDYFATFDQNGNGKVSLKEFRRAADRLGIHMTHDETRQTLVDIDKTVDGDGFVTVGEIERYLRHLERTNRPSANTLFPAQTNASTRPRFRASVSVPKSHPEETRETLTGTPRKVRSATPTRTTKRRSVSGTPEDTRTSILRHTNARDLFTHKELRDHIENHTEYITPDVPPDSEYHPNNIPEVPLDIKWDRQPLRNRSGFKDNFDRIWEGTPQEAKASEESSRPRPSEPFLNEAAAEALKSEREKRFLLALEENVIAGLQDSSIDRIELTTPIPKDLQGLVENLADYYSLKYEVNEPTDDEDNVNMTLLRTDDSKVRTVSLAKMCEEPGEKTEDEEGDATSGDGAPKDSDSKKGATPRSNGSKGEQSKRPSVTSKNSNKTPPKSPARSPGASPRSNNSNNSKKSGGSKKGALV